MSTAGTFRIVLESLATAAANVRVWALGWLAVSVPAVLLAYPLLDELGTAFDRQPAATFAPNLHLDADFVRDHPHVAIASAGAVLFALFGWTFLGGGVLATVGGPTRLPFAAFLAACGRYFWRHLRVLGLGFALLLLLVWGGDALGRVVWDRAFADVDPGTSWGGASALLSLGGAREASRWLGGFLLVFVLFTAKVARAHVSVHGRRSAFVAWGRALRTLLRHPLRATLIVLLLVVLYAMPQFVLGLPMPAASGGGDLWWLLLLGQVQVVWLQIVLVTALLCARELAGLHLVAAPPGVRGTDLPIPDPEPAAFARVR